MQYTPEPLTALVAPGHTAVVMQEPQGAVTGVPAEYGAAVGENALSLLATITTTDDLLAAWNSA